MIWPGSDSADADTKSDTEAIDAAAASVVDARTDAGAVADTEATDGEQYQTAKSITLFLDVRSSPRLCHLGPCYFAR